MNTTQRSRSLLAEMELDSLEEGREWTRKRLEEKLQKLNDEQGAISPPQPTAAEEPSPKKAKVANRRRRDRP